MENCLRPGHVVSICKNLKVCHHCGESHHQSICPSLSNPCSDGRPTTSSPEQKSAIQPQPTQLETREQLFYKQKKLCPSMQTTWNQHVCILFDNGSQHSYVTSNLKPRLNLKPIKTEMLHRNTFGGSTFRKQSYEVVKLWLRKHEGEEVKVTALNYPIICSPLPLKVEVNYPHLEDLQLADSPTV